MKRLLPKSLLGQVTLAVALTLFLVQGINGFLAYRIEKDRSETALVNRLGLRLVASAKLRSADFVTVLRIPTQSDGDGGAARRDSGSSSARDWPRRGGRRFAGTDFTRAAAWQSLPGDRPLPALKERLAETLRDNGREFSEIRLVSRPVASDPDAQRFLQRFARRRNLDESELPQSLAVAGIRDDEGWDIVRAPIRPTDESLGPLVPLARAAALTLLLSLVLWLVLRRITLPLADLTRRTEEFSHAPGANAPMDPRGPEDLRRLISAHNAMEARIGAMIEEKDVMLGAIGHDLKTPLAALRVRVESVENETARGRMVDSIEDITRTLDEILLLARLGRAERPAERTDLYALLASVVEEFEDMELPVSLADGDRLAAPVHLTWAKRAVRNLVSNALRYGGTAHIALESRDGEAIISVEDSGPGIPEENIAAMMEPFTRGEASRNRATGGAGLGLTIARAIAEQHGGTLAVANRAGGGLRAELRLPF